MFVLLICRRYVVWDPKIKDMKSLEISKVTTTLVDLAEEAIMDFIKGSDLQPGDKFPFDESQLAEKLQVSRNVIREALSRLQSIGLIESRKRNGIIMREPSLKHILNRIINPKLLSENKITDLLELRYILEIGIVPIIFENINKMDISELRKIIPNTITSNVYVRLSADEEIEFHSRIYKVADNKVINELQQIIIPIYKFIQKNHSEFDIYNKKIRDEKLFASHSDLIDALESGDQKKYEDVIKRHLLAYHLYIKEQRQKNI